MLAADFLDAFVGNVGVEALTEPGLMVLRRERHKLLPAWAFDHVQEEVGQWRRASGCDGWRSGRCEGARSDE